MCDSFSRRVPPCFFRDAGQLRSSSGNNDVNVDMGTLRHHRKVGRRDRWTSASTIAVPGDDDHDPYSALGYTETGNTSVINGVNAMTRSSDAGIGHSPAVVGFFRARESPQTIAIESLPLGRSGGMESRLVGFPVTEQRHNAGNRQCEFEGGNGRDGNRGERRSRTRSNVATYTDIDSTASDGGDSGSVSQGALGLVQNDRVEGVCFCYSIVSGSLFVS